PTLIGNERDSEGFTPSETLTCASKVDAARALDEVAAYVCDDRQLPASLAPSPKLNWNDSGSPSGAVLGQASKRTLNGEVPEAGSGVTETIRFGGRFERCTGEGDGEGEGGTIGDGDGDALAWGDGDGWGLPPPPFVAATTPAVAAPAPATPATT